MVRRETYEGKKEGTVAAELTNRLGDPPPRKRDFVNGWRLRSFFFFLTDAAGEYPTKLETSNKRLRFSNRS